MPNLMRWRVTSTLHFCVLTTERRETGYKLSIRVGKRIFAAELVPSALALVLFAVFLTLCSWQLDRAQEKKALFSQFETGASEQALLEIPTQTGDARYRMVRLTGRYDSMRQILIDQMTHHGRIGYQVLTPFVPSDGSPIALVNRGWIPAPPRRDQLPDISVSGTDRVVTGRLDPLRRPALRPNKELPVDATWPRRMVFPDGQMLGNALQTELAAYVVLLNADQTDGYARQWKPRVMGPGKHIGYAIQWFSLAVLVLTIYLWLGFSSGAQKNAKIHSRRHQ